MTNPILVIMAAGLGTRFGGNGQKQVTPVDEAGHFIIHYSLYDAWRAGFQKAVIVINPEHEAQFHTAIGARVAPIFPVEYAYQTLSAQTPAGYERPEGRTAPWGTGHAALCAADHIDAPFVVINADDFYGRKAFQAAADFVARTSDAHVHAMVGYRLSHTLSAHGTVARGVCDVDDSGALRGIAEHLGIRQDPDGIIRDRDTDEQHPPLSADTTVSMNFWVFQPGVLPQMRAQFHEFLTDTVPANPKKAEFFLPKVADALIHSHEDRIEVVPTPEQWFGMTYAEDLASTRANIAAQIAAGVYPAILWPTP